MFCPFKMVSMPRATEPGDEELLKCEETGCAWWIKWLGDGRCAVPAVAVGLVATFEKQGK